MLELGGDEAALHARTVRNGFSIAGVGYVRWADRDAIPVAADFLLTEENVHTSIVYGLLGEEDGREVVRLRYQEGFTYQEISDITEHTVPVIDETELLRMVAD